MLTTIDRIQATTADRNATARCWESLLGAERMGDDRIAALAAQRSTLRVGASEVELLEPDGAGPVQDHLTRTRGGPFAAGFGCDDLPALRAELDARSVPYAAERDQLFAGPEDLGVAGLRLVISPSRDREPAGLLRNLYEVTHLTADAEHSAQQIATIFGLDRSHFTPIESAQYGYAGWLTLFHPDHLHRIETITPGGPEKTMGRFFDRIGDCLYMCYAECDATATVRDRLLESAPHDWTGPRDGAHPDGLFVHPRALGGVMLGVSRTGFAWTWSGHPERVPPAPRA